MSGINGEYIDELMSENAKLKTLIADLTYNGTDRGYTRGSLLWEDQVTASARACGLTLDLAIFK
jgi:hypothetical protein